MILIDKCIIKAQLGGDYYFDQRNDCREKRASILSKIIFGRRRCFRPDVSPTPYSTNVVGANPFISTANREQMRNHLIAGAGQRPGGVKIRAGQIPGAINAKRANLSSNFGRVLDKETNIDLLACGRDQSGGRRPGESEIVLGT
jgi:hypothetical protein